jgi:phosphopantothenoylcysteine decarboxylase/phosphopantothenate--cysteine ligase
VPLKGKKVLLGVSSSIAIYKALDVCSQLRKRGAEVKVVMTLAATRLVAPLTFEVMSQNPVCCDLFTREHGWEMEHLSYARWGDCLLIAPATANIIGKCASGVADDALSTLFLSFEKPVLIAPAMNTAMYLHPATQANLRRLRERGAIVIEPESGQLACGDVGVGRLAAVDTIIAALEKFFTSAASLAGRCVLVTAGATREPLDPVRFISNPSTGKMGFALAEEAQRRGADTILVSGPTHLQPPPGVDYVSVTTAQEMHREVLKRAKDCDVIVFAAAVSDYRPEKSAAQKVKKSDAAINVTLVPNPDIAADVAAKAKPRQVLIGFAAETHDVLKHAREKLRRKRFSLIVANDVSGSDSGFASDYNTATLISRTGKTISLPRLSKKEVAIKIFDEIIRIVGNRKRR